MSFEGVEQTTDSISFSFLSFLWRSLFLCQTSRPCYYLNFSFFSSLGKYWSLTKHCDAYSVRYILPLTNSFHCKFHSRRLAVGKPCCDCDFENSGSLFAEVVNFAFRHLSWYLYVATVSLNSVDKNCSKGLVISEQISNWTNDSPTNS